MARKPVLSFKDVFPNETIALFAMRLASRYGIRLGDQYAPVDPPVQAFVNAAAQVGYREMSGRWIAHCECGGAELIDVEQPIFMCCSCFNEAHHRQWRNVIVPENRAAIETILAERPGQYRFWSPGESIEQLQFENEELSKRLQNVG